MPRHPAQLSHLHPDVLETARVLAEIELRRIFQGRPEAQGVAVRPVEWQSDGDWLVRRGVPRSWWQRLA
jgi:hypothetical protein